MTISSSGIDDTKPVEGNPTTQSVRDNFTEIKAQFDNAQTDVTAVDSTLTTHTGNVSNPHSVTAAQLNLVIGTDVQAYSADLTRIDTAIDATNADATAITINADESVDFTNNIYADNIVESYDNIAALRAITTAPQITLAKTKGYTTDGDGGGGDFYWDSTSTETDSIGTIIKATAITTGRWMRLYSGAINVKWFGAKVDGVTDDSVAVQAADAVSAWEVTGGICACNSLVITNSFNTSEDSTLLYNGAQNGTLMTIATNGLKADSFIADAGTEDCVLLSITSNDCHIKLVDVSNVIASAAATGPYGLSVTGNDNDIDKVIVRDFANTGHTNGSFPQAVALLGAADGNNIGEVRVLTGQSGFITGSSSLQNSVGRIICEGMSDNGVYQLGGILDIGEIDYYGTEEPVVIKGDCTIGKLVVRGAATTCVSLDNAGNVHIGMIEGYEDDAGNSPASLVRLRSGNTASGRLFVGQIRGRITGDNLCGLNAGTIEYVTILDVDIEYLYDAGVSGSIAQWANLGSCKGFNIKNWNIKIIDVNDVLTSSNRFALTAPTANLEKESFAYGIDINITGSDETTRSAGEYRGISFAQGLVHVKGGRWQTNIGPYLRNLSYGEPETYTGATPTNGTWRSGIKLYDFAPSASGVEGEVCVSSGTFSSATDATGDTDGSTAVITGMTDTSDFFVGDFVTVSAGFPSVTDPYQITAITSTTITLDTLSTSSQTNITVATVDPVFKDFGSIAA